MSNVPGVSECMNLKVMRKIKTRGAVILHCGCWHSALHTLSSLSSQMEAEPEMPLHKRTCRQELKLLLKNTTSTTAAIFIAKAVNMECH